MNDFVQQASATARRAVRAKNWPAVKACAKDILNRQRDSAEGHFLLGLVEKASGRPEQAIKAFTRSLAADERRYDAAVEMASQYLQLLRYGDAAALLESFTSHLGNSPLYLDMAGNIYSNIGLPEKAWPLHKLATELQPGASTLLANFAACSVYVGKIDEAQEIYENLIEKNPQFQRNHYEFSRLARASDDKHVEQMKALLESVRRPPEHNIYLYYALGKELEDLERWDEAFGYYKMAGDTAARVGNYDVGSDIDVIDRIIDVCDEEWLSAAGTRNVLSDNKCPIFIVGLPRTGTTLTERIVSSHSQVGSIGESFFMQLAIKQLSGVRSDDPMNAAIIEVAAKKDVGRVADTYLGSVKYRVGDRPKFIEKLPENFLYMGFIAKAFPEAPIIHLHRDPMDACFAMYKQSYFRYAYTLDDLGRYYVAYDRLRRHWQDVLGDRVIDLDYEGLVSDQEQQTRALLDKLGLPFEQGCLEFEKNNTASNTASSVQIREKIHARSVKRWKHFESHLQPLKHYLQNAGIQIA